MVEKKMNIEVILIQFMILYFFNLLFDYPLQGAYLAEGKKNSPYLLWVHSSIWGFGLSILLIPLGLFTWAKMIMLVTGHYFIDYWKILKENNNTNCNSNRLLYIDQTLHILQLIICLI